MGRLGLPFPQLGQQAAGDLFADPVGMPGIVPGRLAGGDGVPRGDKERENKEYDDARQYAGQARILSTSPVS